MTPKTKNSIMKECKFCGASFDARAITQHTRACKEKQEIIKIEQEAITSQTTQEQTPQGQQKATPNPSKKLKTVLIIPLILILALMKSILLTTSKTKQETKENQNPQQEIKKSRYLMNR